MLSLFFFLRWSCFGDHKTLLRELVQRWMTGAHWRAIGGDFVGESQGAAPAANSKCKVLKVFEWTLRKQRATCNGLFSCFCALARFRRRPTDVIFNLMVFVNTHLSELDRFIFYIITSSAKNFGGIESRNDWRRIGDIEGDSKAAKVIRRHRR